jgi:hypothetical protein
MSRATSPPALDWLPNPPELDQAPALGVLALVAAALDIAAMALLAAHPELADSERPAWLPSSPALPAASAIVRLADRLRAAIGTYRRAVLPPSSPTTSDDNIPF